MRRLAPFLGLAGIALLASCGDVTQPDAGQPALSEAGVVPGQYIVVFNTNVADPPALGARLAAEQSGAVLFTYQRAIKGFAFRGSYAAAQALARNPDVAYVEPDREVQLFDTQTDQPSWGIDRVDQRDLPLDASYTFNNDGSGANVYVLDTGVRRSHNDFGGRVEYIPNGSNGDFVGDGHGSAEDCHGHGTHVAGTAAGSTFGVAKGSPVWAGRVVNCNGSGQVSMAIAGVDWITANGIRPAVVNMSLGYGDVQSLRDAVENSVAAGVNYAVAAGNGNFAGIPQDACNQSPAGAPNANTVGATTINDDEASFSNYGTCVDILAPGVSITSAWYTGDNATNTISGTSMATPHVAGAVALYLTANPSASPAQASAAFTDNATAGRIDLHSRSTSNGTPNLLLYTAFIGGGGEPPPNNPPSAAFSSSCADLTCAFTDASTDSDGSVVAWSWDFGDGGTATAQNPSHTYAAGGTYTVTLTVTDDDGATDATSASVTVSAGDENSPPSASFTSSCTDLSCSFTDTSTDADGSVVSWSWDFGDGGTSTAQHASHTYAAGGTYTVSLTVTDDDGATDTVSQAVMVSEPPSGDTSHVGDLDGASVNNGSTWTAQVTVRIHDAGHNAVSNATVSFSWSGPVSATGTCTTGADGACVASIGGIHKRNGSVTFSVTGVAHASLTYDAAANHDPDGDSNGTSISVAKP